MQNMIGPYYSGMIIGLFIGVFVGVVVTSLFCMAKRADLSIDKIIREEQERRKRRRKNGIF